MNAVVRMTRTRRPGRRGTVPLSVAGPEVAGRQAASQFLKLMQAEATVQEVYLYSWIQMVAGMRRQNPVNTHISEMRFGAPLFVGSDFEFLPCRMAPNTLAATVQSLEEKGLIEIDRSNTGRRIDMAIYLPE